MSATLHVIQSGSAANGYILTCGDSKLILEAGCKPKEYLTALNYDLKGVSGVCVTHVHSDHSRSIKTLQGYGLSVYAPKSVCEKYPECKCVEHMCKYMVGDFWILPLKVQHGDCECMAYHINLPDRQTLLFATDLERFPYNIKGISHIVMECNYSNELVLDSLLNGTELRSQSRTHMELGESIATVRRLHHAGLQTVILAHLSNGLSDEQLFKDRFKSELGIEVKFAGKNSLFVLQNEDF